MFKQLTTGLALMISAVTFSQVGINTDTPHSSADLELASTNKTLYLNRVADPAADVANPQEGMVLYDITMKCLRAYQGDPAEWSGCLDGGDGNGGLTGTVSGLNCAAATFNPAQAAAGQAYNGTLRIPYTGGNGGVYPAQTATVGDFTISLPLGVFATGDGVLEYTITGTPAAAGTATFNVSAGGQSCNALSLIINPATENPGGVLPGTVTLAQNSRYFIASVYDNDYLPYTKPTAPANTSVINAGGGTDTLVDILGTINTTGITVYIPATVTGSGGNVAAWSSTITVPANLTQNGVATQVQLSWAAQTLTTANSSLVATIKAVGGTLEAKKLDINAGIGNDYLGVLLGTFQYPYNQAGTLTNYELRDIPGIPDRMFGQIDNAGDYAHNFLYLPVQAEDGKIWLNNNLGANYANVDHPLFNLTQQAKSATDRDAMGSLFQWGRKADGHELVNRYSSDYPHEYFSNSTIDSFKHGAFDMSNPSTYGVRIPWDPGIPERIYRFNGTSYDWVIVQYPVAADGTRWNADGANNPCPQGFKVPLQADWTTLRTAAGNVNLTNQTKKIKLTNAGEGTRGQTEVYNSTTASYWVSDGYVSSGSHIGSIAHFNGFTIYGSNYSGSAATYSHSVRCIQQ